MDFNCGDGKSSVSNRLVRMVVRRFVNFDIYDEDDLFQEGCIALLKAEKTYNEKRGIKFETYASTVIRNRITDILRKNGEKNEGGEIDNETGKNLEHEVDFIEKREILNMVLQKCTDIERAVWNAYIGGYSYIEIEKIFAINKKKIDNTVQKIKKLAAKIFVA
jgi:RNA polymerase sporulation-specific sigma factor